MKRWLAAIVGLGLVLVAAVVPTWRAGHPGVGSASAVLEPQEREAAPEDWMLTQRAFGSGVPREAPRKAALAADRLAALAAARDPQLAAAAWQAIGPTNIGGRVLDVALDPANANTIYIATASGGVWRSTDGAATFTEAWPRANPQPIGAIAMASDGALYAGTGESGPGGGSITYGGRGLYKSTNGGASWTNVGLRDTVTTGRIVVDPANPERIFVASSGDLFNPGGGRGVYRSIDGGASWSRVLAGDTATTGAVDLAIDPQNPQRIFAAMWDHIRYPNLRVYGGVGSGVYRSTDGGDTWQRLAGGLPGPSADVGRIGVAIAPSNPNRVYAIVIKTDGTFRNLYRSSDGGETWQALTDPGLAGSQSTYGWWFGRLWVDPVNAQHVFAAGIELEESTNGGSSWIGQFSVHADQHGMAWSTVQAGLVYLGNDGGVYRSTSNGTGGWVHAQVEPFTQFYSVDVSEQDQSRVIGGAQDNSVLRSWPGNWNAVIGGDGEEALIDPTNHNNVYGCSQYGFCSYSRDGGTTFSSFGSTNSTRYNWFTPVQFDPTSPAVMYLGGNRLNRSTNRAQTWTVISPDLTGGPGPDPNYVFGTITTVAAAKSNGQVLFAGTDDGRVWTTPDLGATWIRVGQPGLPSFWVTRVTVDQATASTAYATFSGYRGGNNGAYVFKTTDGGTTWTDITGNLPKAPVNDVVVTATALYVAGDAGVYRSSNGGATWLRVGTGLPRVPVDDIELVAATNQLVAATFGRGMWRVQLPPA
jgi:sortilin (neurotensin receptor 3)